MIMKESSEKPMNKQRTRDDYVWLAQQFLDVSDARGDVLALLTDDIQFSFPKWGTVHGKAQLLQFFQDMSQHVAAMSHPAEHRRFIVDGPLVCVEGLTRGQMQNGKTWNAGRFSTVYEFDGDLIKRIDVYTDPDMTDETRDNYPWLHR
ncbi:nuclear transport factor 2 family protein [Ochrobactrum sp. RH2CCR150]|uniref:nuclear transport factor 2 family protein n=1 Tax=Ochrobactrum sp. RH2CCR150 TaxID=2587044 RepID=UPI0015F90573|nr:ketosteroid isomerase-like protein [Ochrobactrum sp. RH2CCR150]